MTGPRRAFRSLRFLLSAAAAGAAALALALTGLVVVTSVDRSERSSLDRTLDARASRAATVARDALMGPAARAPRGGAATPPLLGPADQRLGDDVAIVRVVRNGRVAERLGSVRDPGLPTEAAASAETVQAGGEPWRIVQHAVESGLAIQAAAPLGPVDQRADRLRNRVAVAGLAGVLATMAFAFALVGPLLGALSRLRRTASGVAATADLSTRVPEDQGPQEVREVSSALNAMLARLEEADRERLGALEATRRFAADAGHELRTPLSTMGAGMQMLADHPEVEGDARRAAFEDVLSEHRRAVSLLASLQALARGDGADPMEREPTDLVEDAEVAIAAARRGHEGARIELDAPEELVQDAWPPGVRIAIENLVRNALAHGRPGGRVVVALEPAATGTTIVVDDDGPGISEAERELVRGRFARGESARGEGSGLGLALVEQQAALHGGTLELDDSPLGGLRARLTLARRTDVPEQAPVVTEPPRTRK